MPPQSLHVCYREVNGPGSGVPPCPLMTQADISARREIGPDLFHATCRSGGLEGLIVEAPADVPIRLGGRSIG